MTRLPPEPDDPKAKTITYGSLMTAALAAASFAAVLTLVGLQRDDYRTWGAMIAFCTAMPLLIAHRVITVDTGRKYKVSSAQWIITLLGIIAFITGMALLVSTVSIIAAAALVLLSLLMVCVVEDAEDRASDQPQNAEKP